MIVVFGSINMDLVATVRAIPRPGETVLSPGYRTLFGGKGANQAVAAARVHDGRVAMVGRIGRDGFGEACRANLAANGVTVEPLVADDAPTGCAFITVDSRGENAITVASGANGNVAAVDLPEALLGPDTMAVMQMEVPLAASLAAARRVKAAGGSVVWNFAPAPSAIAAEDLAALLAHTDIFVVNELEARAAATLLEAAADDWDAAACTVARLGHTTCVVTAGAAGAVSYAPDGSRLHAAALPVTPVDTTGAGDTFVGILAAEMVAHGHLAVALRRACIGASLACVAEGAQTAMPTRTALVAADTAPD
ncbi:ribokinase [Ancylobacter sp. 3268]|uniref:ribokinase n=1 Tax=Ancylobacter sp. 3268 TaxID=2817752 RepID=UPI002859F1C9|nr:ribokinase [Ancylobacter sp. 3268]MDR6950919.1 ribokinase [Ancylobacter sp. 3268]